MVIELMSMRKKMITLEVPTLKMGDKELSAVMM